MWEGYCSALKEKRDINLYHIVSLRVCPCTRRSRTLFGHSCHLQHGFRELTQALRFGAKAFIMKLSCWGRMRSLKWNKRNQEILNKSLYQKHDTHSDKTPKKQLLMHEVQCGNGHFWAVSVCLHPRQVRLGAEPITSHPIWNGSSVRRCILEEETMHTPCQWRHCCTTCSRGDGA